MRTYFTFCTFLLLGSASAFAGAPRPSIVNGQLTQDEPTTGALLLATPPGATPPSYAGICSGTLIGCQSFLTAAHCVCKDSGPGSNSSSPGCNARPAADLRVYLQNGGIHQVSAISVRPDFEFGVAADAAVLTLSAPVQGIPPAAINGAATPVDGTAGTIAGFGATSGASDDFGIKRTGTIMTRSCDDADIPKGAHICWQFDGSPKVADSNICYGDSGGPLYIDQDGKRVVAGVASGVYGDCAAGNFSFATNVYQYRSFVTSSIVNSLDETGKCRVDIRNRVKKYVSRVYQAKKQCIDAAAAGKTPLSACLMDIATTKIAKAMSAFDEDKLARRCPDNVLKKSTLGKDCAEAATPSELKVCLQIAGNAAVSRMLAAEFADQNADVNGIKADKALFKCYKTVRSAGKSYLLKQLNALNQCQSRIDQGKTTDCAAFTQNKLTAYAASLSKKILKACPDTVLAGLQAIDREASCAAETGSTGGLVACAQTEHTVAANDLAGLAPGKFSSFSGGACGVVSQVGDADTEIIQQSRAVGGQALPNTDTVLHTFTVHEGVSLLRVTLNGEETLLPPTPTSTVDNSLDLYLRYQKTPRIDPLAADALSINVGVFEALRVKNPAPGEWRILVHDAGIAKGMPYQLTITMIK